MHRSMVAELTAQLFDGDVTALVSHLLTEQEVDAGELTRLSRLIAEHKKAEATDRKPGRRRGP